MDGRAFPWFWFSGFGYLDKTLCGLFYVDINSTAINQHKTMHELIHKDHIIYIEAICCCILKHPSIFTAMQSDKHTPISQDKVLEEIKSAFPA